MTTSHGSFTVHSEARGPHWVSWLTRGAETKPDRSVILIAATQEEAEARAKRWAQQQEAGG
jgi:hypothetical protein